MGKDPIVDEVRWARLEIEKECDEDFALIHARALDVQKKVSDKVVSRPDPAKMTRSEIEEIATYREEKRQR